MKYCSGVLIQRMKKSTLNFCGLSLLYCLTGLNLEREAIPPSLKLRSGPGTKVCRRHGWECSRHDKFGDTYPLQLCFQHQGEMQILSPWIGKVRSLPWVLKQEVHQGELTHPLKDAHRWVPWNTKDIHQARGFQCSFLGWHHGIKSSPAPRCYTTYRRQRCYLRQHSIEHTHLNWLWFFWKKYYSCHHIHWHTQEEDWISMQPHDEVLVHIHCIN